jgi:hypothetical protein
METSENPFAHITRLQLQPHGDLSPGYLGYALQCTRGVR